MAATVDVVLEQIRPALDADAAKVLDHLVIETRASWDTNALARKGLGKKRVVVLNSGLLVYTEWLTLAMIAEGAGHEGCLRDYTEFLSDRAGVEREASGFVDFARTTHGHCEDAHLDVLDEKSQEYRDRILESVVATVLLHEIGHHVLGHIPTRGNNLYHARLREMAADQWAVQVAVDSNYDLRPAVPMFLVLDTIDRTSFVEEIRSSHPSGLHRIRDLLVQTRTLLEKKSSPDAHSMDTSIRDLDRALQYDARP